MARKRRRRRAKPGSLEQLTAVLWRTILECEALLNEEDCPPERVLKAGHSLEARHYRAHPPHWAHFSSVVEERGMSVNLQEATEVIEQLQLAQRSFNTSRNPHEAVTRLRAAINHARRVLNTLPPQVRGEPTRHIARQLIAHIELADASLKGAARDAS
jgi:hypothetical protein